MVRLTTALSAILLLGACSSGGSAQEHNLPADETQETPPYRLTWNITADPQVFDGLRMQVDNLVIPPIVVERDFSPATLLFQARVASSTRQRLVQEGYTLRILNIESGTPVLERVMVPSECFDSPRVEDERHSYYFIAENPPELLLHSRSCATSTTMATAFFVYD